MEHPPPPATVDELEAVLRRFGTRRRRTIALGFVATLVAGLLLGRAMDSGEGTTDRVEVSGGDEESGGASPDQQARAGAARSRSAAALEGGYVPLAFRTTDEGIELRLHEVPSAMPECVPELPCMPPSCAPTTLQAAASNREAVGMAGGQIVGRPGADELWLLTWTTFGVLEGGPATLAVVAVGDGIETVRLEGDADDEVAVDGEFVALAVSGDGARRVVGLRDGAEYSPIPFDLDRIPDGASCP